ncbi:hypothetical protein LX32DRAFT_645355 [Colletotrichum zoysiae]|uniref:PD-(D/E)XK nuclease-like domain-containing protein n=1 Tax=Colletotrichum zoysiae TaxID=1216348 RepID=A0AAD9H552_9PEZI|nr:hypothetical protein LX32DRAFT_645355 [Colletotrichum zoysiae]
MCSIANRQERIENWLLALPSDTLDLTTTQPDDNSTTVVSSHLKIPKKRRLDATTTTLTPPPSIFGMPPDDATETAAATPKKRRLAAAAADLDITPRGPAEMMLAPVDSASQTGSIASTSTRTSASRKSSPTKQLMSLELGNDPLHFASLDILEFDPSGAPGLRDVYLDIAAFASGVSVIPKDHHPDLPSSLPVVSDHSFFEPDGEQRRRGPATSYRTVERIVKTSHFCTQEQVDEAGWGTEVHHLVLEAALRRPGAAVRDGMVNFFHIPTASVHGTRAGSRMVDYCMLVDCPVIASEEPSLDDAIRRARNLSGRDTLNHTPLFLLRDKPISLSIECKKRDGGLHNADLQISSWHAAQWRYLSMMCRKTGADLSGLPFLPGLVVSGAEWYFVATTRNGNRTTLWTRRCIGATTNVVGTYQIIRTIQYFSWWTQTMYWPWYMENVLGLVEPAAD